MEKYPFYDIVLFIAILSNVLFMRTTVNKHKLTVKRMSDLLSASFLYGIIQDKIV